MLKQLLLSALIIPALAACSSGKKAAEVAPVEVSWAMQGNQKGPNNIYYQTEFCFRNTSDKPLDNNWAIYYNQFPRVPLHSDSSAVKAQQIVGNFYRIYPTEYYKPIAPGDSLKVTILFRGSSIKEIEAPMGMYFVPCDADGQELTPMKMAPVKVAPYGNDIHKRNSGDNYPYPTGQFLYAQDQGIVLGQPLKDYDIIPSVKSAVPGQDTVVIGKKISVSAPEELKNEADFLSGKLKKDYGAEVGTSEGAYPVKLALDPSLKAKNDEAYAVSLAKDGAVITGATPAAVLLGVQTLRGIIGVTQLPVSLQSVAIEDQPDFAYRGFMLDIARNFQTKETIEKVLDQMSYYKLNKFHFHFNDDESWRLEIPGLPELTEYGARRGHTLDEKNMLHPTYGSGPFADDPTSRGYGYFTREQFIDLLRYATKLHIDVIPEIETPGHARAAVYSMKARYEKYKDSDMDKAMEYLMSDDADTSKYTSAQGFHDNVMCVAREGVYNFLDKVVTEIQAMYKEAGAPLYAIQTGGDEVPRGSWLGSPVCQALVESGKVESLGDLRDYFTERFKKILDDKGLKYYGWMEIASKKGKPNPKFQNAGFTAYCWDTVGEWGGEQVPYILANAGIDIILCNAPNLYLDFAYNKHPQEPGLYWGGWVNERNTYDLLPYDVYRSVRMGMRGDVMDWDKANHKPDGSLKEQLTAEGRKHIRGLQAELWHETVKSEDMMEYYMFPKILGMAERAWNAVPRWSLVKDAKQRDAEYGLGLGEYLTKIAVKEMPYFQREGLNFRVASPGIEIKDGMLYISNSVPGAAVHYTTDGSTPDEKSPVWTAPVAVEGTNVKAVTTAFGKKSTVSEYILPAE